MSRHITSIGPQKLPRSTWNVLSVKNDPTAVVHCKCISMKIMDPLHETIAQCTTVITQHRVDCLPNCTIFRWLYVDILIPENFCSVKVGYASSYTPFSSLSHIPLSLTFSLTFSPFYSLLATPLILLTLPLSVQNSAIKASGFLVEQWMVVRR